MKETPRKMAAESKKTKQSVVFRADASAGTGTGHVMRCFALAQELQNHGVHVLFVAASEFPAIESRLAAAEIDIIHIGADPGSFEDAEKTCAVARGVSASWVIIDGYSFGTEYQILIKKAGFFLACIDDYGHAGRYHADLILNQNPYASEKKYKKRDSGTCLLLGTRYALLRKELLRWKGQEREIPLKAQRILVTLGGSDPDNRTREIVSALQSLEAGFFEAKVIAGACNPHFSDLESAVKGTGHRITLLTNVEDMGEMYTWADLAIVGGGSTTLECAFFGVPMITLVIADNQLPVCRFLEKAGAAVNLGPFRRAIIKKLPDLIREMICSYDKRMKLSMHAGQLVDGKGAERVAGYIVEDTVRLRKASPDDCRMIYKLANEPSVREASFSTRSIPWDEHERWFASIIRNPNVVYYIVHDRKDVPVGQVRYEIDGRAAKISISIGTEYRGMNLGTHAMVRSARLLFEQTHVESVHAYIKKTNPVSCRAFNKAGYTPKGEILYGTEKAYHLVLNKPVRQ